MVYWLSFELRMLPGMFDMHEGRKITWDGPNVQTVPAVGDRVKWNGDDGVEGEVTGTYAVVERTFTYEFRPNEGWVCSVHCVADHVPTESLDV